MATFTSQIYENSPTNKLTPPRYSLFLPVSLPADLPAEAFQRRQGSLAQAGCPLWRAFDPGPEPCLAGRQVCTFGARLTPFKRFENKEKATTFRCRYFNHF